jgi:hypothetical protein
MAASMVHVPTFDDLRDFVLRVLCSHADLDFDTPLMESTLYRRGLPCGIEYLLLGPRTVRLSAIWEGFSQRILFYDQDLERFRITPVHGPPADGIVDRDRPELALRSVWKGK